MVQDSGVNMREREDRNVRSARIECRHLSMGRYRVIGWSRLACGWDTTSELTAARLQPASGRTLLRTEGFDDSPERSKILHNHLSSLVGYTGWKFHGCNRSRLDYLTHCGVRPVRRCLRDPASLVPHIINPGPLRKSGVFVSESCGGVKSESE